MYYVEPHCVVCQKRIPQRFYLCKSCLKDYPEPWPKWLRELVHMEQKERDDYRRLGQKNLNCKGQECKEWGVCRGIGPESLKCWEEPKEVSFSDYPPAERLAYGPLNRDFNPYQNGDE